MLDFYADWCVSCKEMEHFTFSDARVKKQLEGMLLLQVDVTANSDEHKALLKRFSLFGPPGIIFFDAAGPRDQGAARDRLPERRALPEDPFSGDSALAASSAK